MPDASGRVAIVLGHLSGQTAFRAPTLLDLVTIAILQLPLVGVLACDLGQTMDVNLAIRLNLRLKVQMSLETTTALPSRKVTLRTSRLATP